MLEPPAGWHAYKASARSPQKVRKDGKPTFEQYPALHDEDSEGEVRPKKMRDYKFA